MTDRMIADLRRVFLVMFLNGGCLAVVVVGLLHEPIADYYCEQEYLPSIGSQLGFKIGRIPVRDWPEGVLAFIQIDDRGPMQRAGFRAGDIPMGVHEGGMVTFCGALERAARGWDARIFVTTSVHWPGTEPQPRELVVPKPPTRK